MSRFLDGISTIISLFHKYAKEDGDCSNLSHRKMQEFIQREFADVIAKPRDPQTIDKILQFLEWDGDGHIDFNEFLLLVFRVAKACYWFQPKGPYLLQRTKLTSSGKLHQEPEIKNRGSSRQLQEEEEQTCENNDHPLCEPELQRDTRVNELETLEEMGSYQQRNTQSVNDAIRSSERREPIPQVYEERSREPCDQRNSQRRRQPPEPNRRGDVQLRKHRSLEAQEPRLRRGERKYQEGPQQDQLADIRSRSQGYETRPLQNRWGSRQPHEPVGPAKDDRNQRPQEADRGSDNQPRKPELLTEERSRYHLRELEQRALEEKSDKLREPECLDSRVPHQSYIKEPLEIDLRYCETCELERRIDEQGTNEENNLEHVESERENHKIKEWEERDDTRRKDREQERRTDKERERDIKVYEGRSRETREREEQSAKTNRRERRERRDIVAREAEIDGRRQRDLVRLERTRETDVLAAEADVKIHRVSQELETRERAREREERGATINQTERRETRDFEEREAEVSGRRQRELVRLERTREADAVAAEAEVKIHRVSRELEPREQVERRERDLELLDAEEERRICLEREGEEPLRERRVKHQRELDLEVTERQRREALEREERGATINLRERHERRDFEAREAEIDGQRQRDLVRLERTRETDVVAAEADVKIHRVSRELEPREELERRQRDLELLDAEEERRLCLEREREEPLRERRVEHQQELDLEVIERRRRQAREREERGATINQTETRERRDFEEHESDIDGRRQRNLVRLERTREADAVDAEADVKIHRVSRELEPRERVDRGERDFERLDAEEERRICLEREREEPLRERRVERQRELDLEVIERRRRQALEREEPGTKTSQRERRVRRDFEEHEAEIDGRRQRNLVRLERRREADAVAAEADVKIHRVSRELEPREELERRERDLERLDAEEERRICLEREREEPLRERRFEHQRELDLEVIERRRRQALEREERGTKTSQRERRVRRDFEEHEAEIDGRRQRDLVRLERTRETDVVAAEADVKIHHVSRELEPRDRRKREDLAWKERGRRLCKREGSSTNGSSIWRSLSVDAARHLKGKSEVQKPANERDE
ncbi:trichohyalin [Pezoporus occidentalis]|uniref:trichohyalin n=1 Tax=Pezoporus occidentalis TaxID=407982 RepID=UPI002F911B91